MAEYTWSCKQCGDCCDPVLFNKELKEKIAKIYPELKWKLATKKNGTSWYYEEKSERLGKCQFCQPDGNGATKCIIYDLRPEICREFGDGDHIFLICTHNPRYSGSEFAKEELLLDLGDSAAWERYKKLSKKIFSR